MTIRIDSTNCRTDPAGQGWFNVPGVQTGNRELSDQLVGLEDLLELTPLKKFTVLDIGCAEGLIGIEFAKQGAKQVLGLEVVPSRVEAATEFARRAGVGKRCSFTQIDLTQKKLAYATGQFWDVVLALAITHKFADPIGFTMDSAFLASKYYVTRLPAPVFRDPRSDMKKVDTVKILERGFTELKRAYNSKNEVTMVFRKIGA